MAWIQRWSARFGRAVLRGVADGLSRYGAAAAGIPLPPKHRGRSADAERPGG